MTDPDIDASVPVHLTRAGILKDCEPNREWFLRSLELSKRAIAFAEEEKDRELMRILDGDE